MIEPNFGEAQLQQTVNGAIQVYLSQEGIKSNPAIPTLRQERWLGWDTGFYLPCLLDPSGDNIGCNFFIQYKISKLMTSPGAKQYEHWNDDYMRFKIPAESRQRGVGYDFSQWDNLKQISDEGYPTYYATNSTLTREELFLHDETGTLLESTPFLDVSSVDTRHIYVTFTFDSDHFKLHSKLEKRISTHWPVIKRRLDSEKKHSLMSDNEKLLELLKKILGIKSDKILDGYPRTESTNNEIILIEQFNFLRLKFSKHIGCTLHRWL